MSASEIENSVKPQSKQIANFGNVKTAGMSMPLRPGKWTQISEAKVFLLLERQDLQGMLPPFQATGITYFTTQVDFPKRESHFVEKTFSAEDKISTIL